MGLNDSPSDNSPSTWYAGCTILPTLFTAKHHWTASIILGLWWLPGEIYIFPTNSLLSNYLYLSLTVKISTLLLLIVPKLGISHRTGSGYFRYRRWKARWNETGGILNPDIRKRMGLRRKTLQSSHNWIWFNLTSTWNSGIFKSLICPVHLKLQ